MNKYSIITIIAIIVIISPFAFAAMNIIGSQQLEYRWYSPGTFSFFTMLNHGKTEFCNTLPFWMTFQNNTYWAERFDLEPSSVCDFEAIIPLHMQILTHSNRKF